MGTPAPDIPPYPDRDEPEPIFTEKAFTWNAFLKNVLTPWFSTARDEAEGAAILSAAYANADTDTDIPGAQPGQRGAKFWADQAAGASGGAGSVKALVGAALGDSITAQSASATQTNNNGFTTWAEIHSRGSLSIPSANLFGVGGNTLSQMLARIGSITALAGQIDFCIIEGGANTGPTFASMRESAAGIINALLAVNILPVFVAAMPSTSANATAQKVRVAYNAWLNDVARNKPSARNPFNIPLGRQVIFSDATPYFVDYASAVGNPIADRVSDGLHWSPTGAYYVGREIWKSLVSAGVVQDQTPRAVTVGDTYDAVNSPNGNMVPGTGAIMQGSGGTVTASAGMATSGPLATGLLWRRWVGNAASTVTFSKDAKPDASSGERQRIQVSVTGTGTPYERYQLKTASALAVSPGDRVELEVEYELNAVPVNCIAICVEFNGQSIGNSQTSVASPSNYPAIAHKGLLRTTYTVPATGVTTVEPKFEIWLTNSASGGSVDVSVNSLVCRRLA